jgi:hypothetical protein
MNILKKGGSREKGGGGNEIHAQCACDLMYNKTQLLRFVLYFVHVNTC